MAQLPSDFTQNDAGTLGDFSPVPADTYTAEIVASAYKPTKAGNGNYISFRFKILEGDYAGKSVFTNVNVKNPNPAAVEIGEKIFNSIKEAAGVASVDDTEQLHGRPMKIKVSVKDDPTYGPGNEIKGYASIDDDDDDDIPF